MNEDALEADEVRVEIVHNEIVGGLVCDGLDFFHRHRATKWMHEVAGLHVLRHLPALTIDPNRVADGSHQHNFAHRQADHFGRRPNRESKDDFVSQLAAIHFLSQHAIAWLNRFDG